MPLAKKIDRQVRIMRANREQRRRMLPKLEDYLGEFVHTAKNYNAFRGISDLNRVMFMAAMKGTTPGAYANLMRIDGKEYPSDRWISGALKGTEDDPVDPEKVVAALNERAREDIRFFTAKGMISPDGEDVSFDIHNMERYDEGKETPGTIRSRPKNGTSKHEGYIVAQIVGSGAHIILGAILVEDMKDVPIYLERLIDQIRSCGVKVNTALLDRGFYSVAVMRLMARRHMRFLMPCVETPVVKRCVREYANGKRERVSRCTIANKDDSFDYFMMITTRKVKDKDGKTRRKRIAFATNRYDTDLKKYGKRWMIETTFSKVEQIIVKTRIDSPVARMACFFYPLLMYNQWIIAKAMSVGKVLPRFDTLNRFMHDVLEGIEVGRRPQPEPPP